MVLSFRPESHKLLADRLRQRRKKELKLSLEVVANRLPAWMHFDHSKLARVERAERDVSYAELREIAISLETTIGELDGYVARVLAAGKRPDPQRQSVRVRRKK